MWAVFDGLCLQWKLMRPLEKNQQGCHFQFEGNTFVKYIFLTEMGVKISFFLSLFLYIISSQPPVLGF